MFSSKQSLYSEKTFYRAFHKDLKAARSKVIIESPFITTYRFNDLLPLLEGLRRRGVDITVNTRNPVEHEAHYTEQAYEAVAALQEIGVRVLYTTKLHRKLSVIDSQIVWEGSLNILSFTDSCELMRRHYSPTEALETIRFLRIY